MRIFNEETTKNSEVVLLLSRKDARLIIEALAKSCEVCPKKTTWKKALDELEQKAGVY